MDRGTISFSLAYLLHPLDIARGAVRENAGTVGGFRCVHIQYTKVSTGNATTARHCALSSLVYKQHQHDDTAYGGLHRG